MLKGLRFPSMKYPVSAPHNSPICSRRVLLQPHAPFPESPRANNHFLPSFLVHLWTTLQCAMGLVASMAFLATWNLQLAEPKGRARFRIRVFPPN
jgi:hypothetical protein